MLGHNVIRDCKRTLELHLKESQLGPFHILSVRILADAIILNWASDLESNTLEVKVLFNFCTDNIKCVE